MQRTVRPTQDPAFAAGLWRLQQLFGQVHHVRVFECHLGRDAAWLSECIARLFVHARLYQCARFYGDGVLSSSFGSADCPGGCGLRRRRPRERRLAARRRPKAPATVSSPVSGAGLNKYGRSVYGRTKVAAAAT